MNYNLDEHFAKQIELTFTTFTGRQGGEYVHVKNENNISENVNCTSKYMLLVMPRVEVAWEKAFYWILSDLS